MGDRFDFAEDERGVSGVVGFILVFAILVILLSINQAQVVPAENAEVEFQHFQEVRDDLVEVRSAISTAGQTDVSQFPTVNLGTDYPPRILAVNPPPATGTLRTSDAYNITITDASGTTERIETRFLEYRPSYHELDVGSTWYENSVLYLDERDQGGLVVIEEQGLVVGDDSLRITALQNEYRRSGSGRVALELYPTDASDVNISDLTGELTVTLPTRLTGADYWTGAFDDEPAFSPTVDQDWYETGIHALNFSVEKEKVILNTVGVQAIPEGTSAKQNVGIGDDHDSTEEFPTKIVDQGQMGSLARYEVSYDASEIPNFNQTEIVIRNLDSGGADATYVSNDQRDNIDNYGWSDQYGGTGGDSYQITINVYDDSGSIVDSRTVNDLADNSNPSGNDDLSESDSPTLDSAQLSDLNQNNVEYDLEYVVSDTAGKFSETEVLFLNTDSPYATDQETGFSLSEVVSYSGYSIDDQFQIYVQVQDDDGIVVDQTVISDTADGADSQNGQLSADFTYDRSGQSDNVDLDAGPSTGQIDTYEWDIGDDGTIDENGMTVNKANIPENTDVRLIVTDSDGNSDEIVKNVP